MPSRFALAILSVIGLFFSGCGGPERPKMFPAKGKITVKGQAVEGATVAFHPVDDQSKARAATAVTQKDGTFVLGTFQTGDGAVEGEYKVTVIKKKVIDEAKKIDPRAMTPGAPPAAGGGESTKGPVPELYTKMMINSAGDASLHKDAGEVPIVYATPASSDLKAVVGPDSPNDFTFDLK